VFVCMLAAYLLWHIRKTLAPLCFADEEIPQRSDPVAPATRSKQAKNNDATTVDSHGESLHDLSTL